MTLAEQALSKPALAGEYIARAILPADRMDDDKARAGCIIIAMGLANLINR